MMEHAVVIAGGGPTGLMLAGELALAGVDVAIVERRTSQDLVGSRAGGLHARTLEVLDQRGIADRFVAAGQQTQVVSFAGARLDISDFPTRFPYTLGLWQKHIERIMADWIGELPVRMYRGAEVTDFVQEETGVNVQLSDTRTMRAQYLVGCDGGRSTVRRVAGIGFLGWDATVSNLIAEGEMTEVPELGMRQDATGVHGIGRTEYEIRDGQVVFKDHGPVRVMLTERSLEHAGEPTLDDLRNGLRAVYGTDFGIHDLTSISRFTDATRQAANYRDRRVLLAGDAAHIHAPDGGQGLNTGVQDAVNLGWKLARVVNGTSPDSLLDSYNAERHPVAARVLRSTMAAVALRRNDERTSALRDTIAELVVLDQPRRQLAAELTGLGIRYDIGDEHPLLGRRMPDLDLLTARGSQRVFTLLHKAQPLLLEIRRGGVNGASEEVAAAEIKPWADHIQSIVAEYDGPWELPAIGSVEAPSAVLIRPDGYVAWVGMGERGGLAEALGKWLGGVT